MSIGAVGRAVTINPSQPTQVPAAAPDVMAAVLAARPSVAAAQQSTAAMVTAHSEQLDVCL